MGSTKHVWGPHDIFLPWKSHWAGFTALGKLFFFAFSPIHLLSRGYETSCLQSPYRLGEGTNRFAASPVASPVSLRFTSRQEKAQDKAAEMDALRAKRPGSPADVSPGSCTGAAVVVFDLNDFLAMCQINTRVG